MSKNDSKSRISYNQYKLADLFIFLIIMCACEMINVFAISKWFPNMLFTISVMLLVTLIVMIRWNWLGVIFPIIDAVLFCALNGAEGWQFGQYIIGNACVSLSWLLFLVLPKEKLTAHWYWTALYALCGFVLLLLGRAVGGAIFGQGFVSSLLTTVVGESLNFVFALIGLLIMRRVSDMLCDQKKYLFKVTKERDTVKPVEEDMVWDGYSELSDEDLSAFKAMDDYDRALNFSGKNVKPHSSDEPDGSAEQ
ncbi:MAG: hypothetical protein ACI4MS_05180 [Candidatus Coproplasma sp.]